MPGRHRTTSPGSGEADQKLHAAIKRMDRQAGIDAMELANRLKAGGVGRTAAEQAIQSALDKGALRLGAQLRLYPDDGTPPTEKAA